MSRAIAIASSNGSIHPLSYCRSMTIPSHILYADDILIFCAGTKKNIRCLLNIFNRYSAASGQVINFEKSKMYTGAMTPARRMMLAHFSGFSAGSLPFQYLGCPIFKGRPKCIHFQYLVDRIKTKLATWKGALLTIMGRVQLVKSIIHGMLVYSFHIYRWPTKLLKRLDGWIKNFVWSGDIYYRKVCMVAWKMVCLPWDSGG